MEEHYYYNDFIITYWQHEKWVKINYITYLFNPLTAGAAYIRVFIFH